MRLKGSARNNRVTFFHVTFCHVRHSADLSTDLLPLFRRHRVLPLRIKSFLLQAWLGVVGKARATSRRGGWRVAIAWGDGCAKNNYRKSPRPSFNDQSGKGRSLPEPWQRQNSPHTIGASRVGREAQERAVRRRNLADRRRPRRGFHFVTSANCAKRR